MRSGGDIAAGAKIVKTEKQKLMEMVGDVMIPQTLL
jgi:hypothetical protein